ncbi:MAG: hypothetical protein ACOCXQ_04015 [Patescibacteria group bacterium]
MLEAIRQSSITHEVSTDFECARKQPPDERTHKLLQEASYTYLHNAIAAIPPSSFKTHAGPYLRSRHFIDAILNTLDPHGRSGLFRFVEPYKDKSNTLVPFGAEVYFQAQAITSGQQFSPDHLDSASLEHYEKIMTYLSTVIAHNEILRTQAARLLGHHLAAHYSEVALDPSREPILDNPFFLRIDDSGLYCSSRPNDQRGSAEVHTPFRASSTDKPGILCIGGGLTAIPFAEANDILPTTNYLCDIEPATSDVMKEFIKLRGINNAHIATLAQVELLVPETSAILINNTVTSGSRNHLQELLSVIHGITSQMSRPPRVIVQEQHLGKREQGMQVIEEHEMIFHRPKFVKAGKEYQMRAFSYLPHLFHNNPTNMV